MSRLSPAFRSFFGLLVGGELPADVISALGLEKRAPRPAARPPVERAADGALQLLATLQRDARLVDFLMEEISGYSNEQIGAAVRGVHEQCRQSLARHVRLVPVIDGVEGSYTKLAPATDPARVKLLGNVPPGGLPPGGTLRHKGWRAEMVELPPLTPRQDTSVVAPAEIEIN